MATRKLPPRRTNAQLLRLFKNSKQSAYALAKAAGVGESTIGRWRKGESELMLSTAEAIARALDAEIIIVKQK